MDKDVSIFAGNSEKKSNDEDSWQKEFNDACTMSYTTVCNASSCRTHVL